MPVVAIRRERYSRSVARCRSCDVRVLGKAIVVISSAPRLLSTTSAGALVTGDQAGVLAADDFASD